MQNTKSITLKAAFTLFGLLFSACNYTPELSTAETNHGRPRGNLRILATDDPFPFSSVAAANVTVSKIDLRGGSGYIQVLDSPVTLDLVQLRNGITTVLADLDVPQGSYDQIRLFISAASVDLKDGRRMNLTVPSGAQTGLKVFVSPAISVSTELSTDLLLDFDLSRSFIALGNPRTPAGILGFNFAPVIRASNLTTSGTLAGTVQSGQTTPNDPADDLPLEGALVTVSRNGVAVTTAVTEADGTYRIIGLEAGSYELSVSADGHVSSPSASITIISGNVLNEATTLEMSPSPGQGPQH